MKKSLCKMLAVVILVMVFVVPTASHAAWGDFICTVTEVEYLNSGAVKVYLTRVSDSETFEVLLTTAVNEKLAIALTAAAGDYSVMANFNDTATTPVAGRFALVK